MITLDPSLSDYIELYPISTIQLARITRLKEPRITWEERAAMNLPVKIGRYTPKAIEAFAPREKNDYFRCATAVDDYAAFTSEELVQKLSWALNNTVPIYAGKADHDAIKARVNPQFGLAEAELCLDQRFFSSKSAVRISFDLIGRIASADLPDQLLARPWHMHAYKHRSPLEVTDQEFLEYPERIWLGRSDPHTEVICNEWEYKGGELKLNPLVRELLVAEEQHFKMLFSSHPELARVTEIIDRLSTKIAEEGMLFQAKPYEIVLIDGYTLHRSAVPAIPCMSALSRLRVQPEPSIR